MRDLEIRGAGNLLGAEQSGHIAAVGFDTYARILQESVGELQGQPMPERAGAPDRSAGEGVRPAGVGRPGVAAPGALPADSHGRRPRDARSRSAPRRWTASARCRPRSRCCSRSRRSGSPRRVWVWRRSALTRNRCGTPVPLDDAQRVELAVRVSGATFHEAKGTLNLAPDRVFGLELVRWVEAMLRRAVGEPAEPGVARAGRRSGSRPRALDVLAAPRPTPVPPPRASLCLACSQRAAIRGRRRPRWGTPR